MPKSVAFQQALCRQLQCQLALPDGALAVVHPPGPQARLGHRKAVAPASQQMVGRHAHLAQHNFAMPFGRVVVDHGDVARNL